MLHATMTEIPPGIDPDLPAELEALTPEQRERLLTSLRTPRWWRNPEAWWNRNPHLPLPVAAWWAFYDVWTQHVWLPVSRRFRRG